MAIFTAFPVINLPATGRVIKLKREAAGLTVQDVQNYFGFEYPQAIYKWQQGKSLPSLDNLLALSRLLRVPMEDLLVYEDQEVPLVFGGISMIFPLRPAQGGIFIYSSHFQNKKAFIKSACAEHLFS